MTSLFKDRIEASVILGAVAVALLFTIATKGLWLQNLPSLLILTAGVGIVAIGQAVLMTSGEVDLSVGSVYAFSGVGFIWFMGQTGDVALAAILAIAVASLIGALNGALTTWFHVPSMIVTMGGMFVYRGCVYLMTAGHSLSTPRPLRDSAVIEMLGGRTAGVSHSILILLVVMAAAVFMLARTRLGNHIFSVGGEPQSAAANGISPARVKIIAFSLCSSLAALAAVVAVCREGTIYATSGKLMELETIAAAVIGGCTLRGGIGSAWGAVLGVFVLSSLKGGLMMMGAPTSWYVAFVGLILIGFLVSSRLVNGRLN